MSNLLALRLEDAAGVTFTESKRLKLLNNAQLTLSQLLHNAYLTELEILQETLTATTGVYSISSLSNDVLRGGEGIVKVKINGGKYCSEIDMKSIKRTENTYLAGSVRNPLYYVFQNNIYISNGETNPVIDVYYLKIPTPLVRLWGIQGDDPLAVDTFEINAAESPSATNDFYNGAVIFATKTGRRSYHVVTDYVGATRIVTVEPALGGGDKFDDSESFYFLTGDHELTGLDDLTSDLNESLHELMVTLAEAEGWGMDRKFDRRKAALDGALSEIQTLNERFTKAEGIGIQNR